MSNAIKIYQPVSRFNQFDADENAERKLVYAIVLPEIKKERVAEQAAELMFHILNAPEEILSEIERKIASGFRSIEGNYSLSTGDVVEVDGTKFLCESFGWKEI